jgi:hypothetical protein
MRTLVLSIALLLTTAFCFGQDSIAEVTKASQIVKSGLIDAPSEARERETIAIQMEPHLKYTITPTPKVKFSFIDEETKLRVVLIHQAEPPGYKVEVDYAIIHPTVEQAEASPPFADKAELVKWLMDPANSMDEVYQDEVSIVVKPDKAPEPGPDPTPDPTPDPDVKPPIPDPGFRVLIMFESESKDSNKLPALQKAIIWGADTRAYLDQVCVKEPSGRSAWRMFDPDQDVSGEYDVWKTAMQRKPDKLPWVLISNGKTGYEGPLQDTPSKFMEECKKHLGAK